MVSAANSESQAPNLPTCCQKKVILLPVRPLDHGNDDYAPQSCPFLTPNGAILIPGAQRTRLCPRPGAGAPSHPRTCGTKRHIFALFLGQFSRVRTCAAKPRLSRGRRLDPHPPAVGTQRTTALRVSTAHTIQKTQMPSPTPAVSFHERSHVEEIVTPNSFEDATCLAH